MAADDITYIADEGDQPIVSLYGADPSALGIDADGSSTAAFDESGIPGDNHDRSFGFTWAFDEETGDFRKLGQSPVRLTELEAFAEWVKTAIRTQRGLYAAAPREYGVDSRSVFTKTVSRESVPSFLESEIRSVLALHPRFQKLQDFLCKQIGSDVYVFFTAVTDAGEVPISTSVGS